MRAPVMPMVPDDDLPPEIEANTRRIASVTSAGVCALMNSPRLLSAACQISSMTVPSSTVDGSGLPFQFGGFLYGSAVAAAFTP
ncbi:hypothetical protein D3C71_1961250 [compost metagenome]